MTLPDFTPSIECGVPGPRGEEGCVLRTPPAETLHWDVENEIASARRHWLEDRQAWWIAASYLSTVVDIALRSFSSVLLLGVEGGDRLLSRDGQSAIQERFL